MAGHGLVLGERAARLRLGDRARPRDRRLCLALAGEITAACSHLGSRRPVAVIELQGLAPKRSCRHDEAMTASPRQYGGTRPGRACRLSRLAAE